MKTIRRATTIAIVPLALATGAVFVAVAGRGESAPEQAQSTRASGAVALLNHRAGVRDQLPAELLALPAAERFGNANGARLAAVSGARRYFVVPGQGASVCLVYVEGSGADFTSAGTCAGRATLATGAVYLSEWDADGKGTVAGIVSDGVTRASAGAAAAAVANNVFVLRGATSGDVHLTGPGVGLDVAAGASAPTEVVTAG